MRLALTHTAVAVFNTFPQKKIYKTVFQISQTFAPEGQYVTTNITIVDQDYNLVGVAVAMVIPTMHEKSCIDLHNAR